jgi:hypothetical protein
MSDLQAHTAHQGQREILSRLSKPFAKGAERLTHCGNKAEMLNYCG